MRRPFAYALAPLLVAGAVLAGGQGRAEAPPAPTRWVTDSAGFLSEGARQQIDARLEAYERQSGHHILVWIGRTTAGIPLEDFTVRAFAAWQVGRKGLDDGLVLFVFSDERKLRVEVGYGLEGQVPDAIASRIIRETIVPRVQAGDHDAAIRDGVTALVAAIDGQATPSASATGPPPDPSSSAGGARPFSVGQMLLVALAVIGFLILFATNPVLAMYLLVSVVSGGRGGGGGGGYSGGGGRGGGGGASGSW